MQAPAASGESRSRRSGRVRERLRPALAAAACLLPWLLAFRHLLPDWLWHPDYRYGLLVPLLAGYLAALRWPSRPRLPASGTQKAAALGLAFLTAALYVPALILREANPDWRLLGWALTLMAAGATAALLLHAGGGPLLRHMAFPLGFVLVAVPWPSALERLVNGWLMPLNAAAGAAMLRWLGLAATTQGHLIQLPQGILDVQEACSGIRSLQSSVMVALFLGEMLHLRWSRRFWLLGGALSLALVFNLARTAAMGLLAAHAGLGEVDRWHDASGLVVLAILLLLLWGLGQRLSRREPQASSPAATGASRPLPVAPAAVLLAGLLSAAAITEAWYAGNEASELQEWTVEPPQNAPGYQPVPIGARTALMLRHSGGWSARWTTPQGLPVHAMHFRWEPGTTPPGHLNVHRPDGCLTALGLELRSGPDPWPLNVRGRRLPFRHWEFADGGRQVHVFYFVEQDKLLPAGAEDFDFSYRRRLRAALQGHRNPGQRLIEAGVWEAKDAEDAAAAVQAWLERSFRNVHAPVPRASQRAPTGSPSTSSS